MRCASAELSVSLSLAQPQLGKNSFLCSQQAHPNAPLRATPSLGASEETKKTKMLAASAKEISRDANLAAVSELKTCKWQSLFFSIL